MNLTVVTGSRADYGLLEWPLKVLREDSFFSVAEVNIWGQSPAQALQSMSTYCENSRPDWMLLLGDRYEIMAAAWAAHLWRVPIAHIGGGDVSEGSYDNAMRDCITRMASLHFITNFSARARMEKMGYRNVHMVGSPGIDYIRNAPWRKERPHANPYVLVSYQPETIDDTVDLDAVHKAIDGRNAIWIKPNQDRGSERIPFGESYSHADFLNLLANCEEFIGNSSAIFYEAPELNVKCKLIGKRQRGRVQAWGDGKASERIRDILKAQGG